MKALFSQIDSILPNQSVFIIAAYHTVLLILSIVIIGLLIGYISSALTGLLASLTTVSIANIIRNYLTYPGTVIHELSHVAFAAITGARITKITLIPKGSTLGSVHFIPRGNKITKGLQMTFASVAPVLSGLILIYFLINIWKHLYSPWQYVLTVYLLVCILLHMNLSIQDIQNALRGLPCTMLILYLLFLILSF